MGQERKIFGKKIFLHNFPPLSLVWLFDFRFFKFSHQKMKEKYLVLMAKNKLFLNITPKIFFYSSLLHDLFFLPNKFSFTVVSCMICSFWQVFPWQWLKLVATSCNTSRVLICRCYRQHKGVNFSPLSNDTGSNFLEFSKNFTTRKMLGLEARLKLYDE